MSEQGRLWAAARAKEIEQVVKRGWRIHCHALSVESAHAVDASREAHIARHDRHALGVDGAQIRVCSDHTERGRVSACLEHRACIMRVVSLTDLRRVVRVPPPWLPVVP